MNMFDLTGKKAIVTGGSRGLGRGMAEGLLEAGAEVVVWGRSETVQKTVCEFKRQGFLCHGLSADIGNPSARKEAFEKALSILDGLDILINAAGITFRHESMDYPRESWEEILEVNLTAPFELSQMAAKEFASRSGGKIINVASMLSFFGATVAPGYAASKGGIVQMSKSLCNEWAAQGINVNCIAPGFMITDMNQAILDPTLPRNQEINGRIPAGRWGTPEDMKGIAVFLASSASDYLNGTVIPIDGGYLVR
ncbi:MAG: SDR family oxidoreductase [Lachnospiraceae bacterium]|nr:SDR family oxidoreductase [Lachnospiraceae bacterium]